MERGSLAAWRDLIESAIVGALPAEMMPASLTPSERADLVQNFRDELGSRRPSDGWLISCAMGTAIAPDPEMVYAEPERSLWRAAVTGGGSELTHLHRTSGPLVPPSDTRNAESHWESELRSLHAASHLAGRAPDGPWWKRCIESAYWLLDEVQPDNATNTPWSVHVFARLHVETGLPEAKAYAETLLHNCRVSLGHPDKRSAYVLIDAAQVLRGW